MMIPSKMASVAYLAAGVAHEINNPTGFVSSNLFTLARYIEDFKAILDAYAQLQQELVGEMAEQSLPSSVMQRCQAITVLEKEIDLEFILKDSQQLISESKEGTHRIQKIVSALKDLAHPSYGTLEEIDINSSLESALISVFSEINGGPEIFKDFSELPKVIGSPKTICQVFINLLINAAQAIEDQGKISITTRTQPNGVVIKIEDTGIGIAQEVIGRIFEPFFTTKQVGQGSGLGLSTVYYAIKNHGGHIDVSSQVGVGTTFIIELPSSPPESRSGPGPRVV